MTEVDSNRGPEHLSQGLDLPIALRIVRVPPLRARTILSASRRFATCLNPASMTSADVSTILSDLLRIVEFHPTVLSKSDVVDAGHRPKTTVGFGLRLTRTSRKEKGIRGRDATGLRFASSQLRSAKPRRLSPRWRSSTPGYAGPLSPCPEDGSIPVVARTLATPSIPPGAGGPATRVPHRSPPLFSTAGAVEGDGSAPRGPGRPKHAPATTAQTMVPTPAQARGGSPSPSA